MCKKESGVDGNPSERKVALRGRLNPEPEGSNPEEAELTLRATEKPELLYSPLRVAASREDTVLPGPDPASIYSPLRTSGLQKPLNPVCPKAWLISNCVVCQEIPFLW